MFNTYEFYSKTLLIQIISAKYFFKLTQEFSILDELILILILMDQIYAFNIFETSNFDLVLLCTKLKFWYNKFE